jgi:hypothetical protein
MRKETTSRLRNAALALAVPAAVLGLASSTASAAPAAPQTPTTVVVKDGTATKLPGPVTMTRNALHVGYLPAGSNGYYCQNFNNHSFVGPMAVAAAASEYNAALTVVSTSLENRAGIGWVYCTSVRNGSSVGTGVTLQTATSL